MSYENNTDNLDYDSRSGADKNNSKMFSENVKGVLYAQMDHQK